MDFKCSPVASQCTYTADSPVWRQTSIHCWTHGETTEDTAETEKQAAFRGGLGNGEGIRHHWLPRAGLTHVWLGAPAQTSILSPLASLWVLGCLRGSKTVSPNSSMGVWVPLGLLSSKGVIYIRVWFALLTQPGSWSHWSSVCWRFYPSFPW